MKVALNVWLALSLMVVFVHQISGQVDAGKPKKIYKPSEKSFEETSYAYYAPIRYIVVYNDVYKGGMTSSERRIDVLMQEKQFNKKNVKAVFNLIKKRYPQPLGMVVRVHTSLTTVETPEERELPKDGADSRFVDKYFRYKGAYYIRSENGSEQFTYTVKLNPYKEKRIVLPSKKTE